MPFVFASINFSYLAYLSSFSRYSGLTYLILRRRDKLHELLEEGLYKDIVVDDGLGIHTVLCYYTLGARYRVSTLTPTYRYIYLSLRDIYNPLRPPLKS
jgi:hypothetical protein